MCLKFKLLSLNLYLYKHVKNISVSPCINVVRRSLWCFPVWMSADSPLHVDMLTIQEHEGYHAC